MSEDIVRQILEDKLFAIWGATTPIVWDGLAEVNPDENHLECSIENLSSTIKSVSCERNFYIFLIDVNTVFGEGSKPNNDFCDTLKDGFYLYSSGNLICLKSRVERIGQVEQYYRKRVLVNVQYDYYK